MRESSSQYSVEIPIEPEVRNQLHDEIQTIKQKSTAINHEVTEANKKFLLEDSDQMSEDYQSGQTVNKKLFYHHVQVIGSTPMCKYSFTVVSCFSVLCPRNCVRCI